MTVTLHIRVDLFSVHQSLAILNMFVNCLAEGTTVRYLTGTQTRTMGENRRNATIPRHTGRTNERRPVGPALRTPGWKTGRQMRIGPPG